jgi:diguanylate cyclase (GGDEF)-like protein
LSDSNIESLVVEPAEDSSARPPHAHPRFDVIVVSVLMVAASLGVAVAIPDFAEPLRDGPWWLPLALVGAFALTDVSTFNFVLRRESVAFSMSEVPMAVAVVFVAPGPALLARLLGGLGVVIFLRPQAAYKLVFNLALFTMELVCTYLFVRIIVTSWGASDTVLVVAVVVATVITSFVSTVLVALAISRFEGNFRGRAVSELRLAWWLLFVNATLAGMVLSLGLISLGLILLAVVPIGLLWYVMKAYGVIDQRLRDLDAVHGFTGRVGQSLDPGEIGRAAVEEAADILHTEGVTLVLFDHLGRTLIESHGNVGVWLPSQPDDPTWQSLIGADRVSIISGNELEPYRSAGSNIREIMVAPISDQSGAIGLVVVAGRTGAGKRFGSDDLVRLQNLTEQLAASLRKGMLHQRIEREARHDGLTGLPNRLSFERSVVDAARSLAVDGLLFVVMLDLDRFKEVNDTLGHHAGDELLIEVGERLRSILQPGDVLARLAGDEFAIVGQRPTHAEMVEFAWECVREVSRPVTLDGLEIVVTASAGVAVLDADHEDGAPLRYADIAMFNAKTQRLGVEVYRDEIDRRTPARLSMLGDLKAAIENDELNLHLQPKLDLASGTIVGAEALVRWTHAIRGVVQPGQFVRVAEDTGLIKQLTDLMLARGIAQLREIHDRGYHLGLAVNLSTHDLLDINLANRVGGHLSANGVDPSMLTLEITESSLLIDAPRARATINELHEVGVRLSIDDFGTGYSSLSYLRRLPVAELKIDQSFVANLLLDEQDEVIVRSTIDLGHNLGLVVVAEGVENNEVLERLRTFGCDIAQGFCISRPLPPAHLMSWLATTSMPSLKTDPLDLSRWVDAGETALVVEPDHSLD